MTKVELQSKIEALQTALQEKYQEQNAYQSQIDTLKKQLDDLNKPKLTMKQFDTLTETIECAVEEFDFSDTDNYSVDFHIDYDNRIAIESFSFDNLSELVREICESVYEIFGEADEDNNQLNQD